MAPPPQPLPDDAISDILLRLPPDDPAGLVRASTVCKAWRRIITDQAFHGRYRVLHPTAPVLVSTTSFRAAAADHRRCHALDCRHGRAVFYDCGSSAHSSGVLGCYVVWDPATGERHQVRGLPTDDALIHATVFCAAAAAAGGGGCDHRGCGGGPFIVAFAGLESIGLDFYVDEEEEEDDDDEEDVDRPRQIDAHASFYASDTGEWSLHTNVHLDDRPYDLDTTRPAALVGDSLYYLCWPGILRYRYGLLRGLDIEAMIEARISRERDILSMMEMPRGRMDKNTDAVLMEAEGGGLGLAYLCAKSGGTMLYLLARETTTVGDEAAAGGQWVQRRVIDLKTLLPVGNDPEIKPCLRGVAQDANVSFVSTEDGVFSIDHGGSSSLQARKVCEIGVVVRWMYPFVSFYTESLLLKLASRANCQHRSGTSDLFMA